MKSRESQVLIAIIELYLETRRPVGSLLLAEAYPFNLSPATLRNIMAGLEADGFLLSKHTSSGRVPSEKALSFYVESQCYMSGLPEEALGFPQPWKDLEHLLEKLADLSQYISFLVEKKDPPLLHRIQCTPLDGGGVKFDPNEKEFLETSRYVWVIIFSSGQVEHLTLEGPKCDQELYQSIERLNQYLARYAPGKTLESVFYHLDQTLTSQGRGGNDAPWSVNASLRSLVFNSFKQWPLGQACYCSVKKRWEWIAQWADKEAGAGLENVLTLLDTPGKGIAPFFENLMEQSLPWNKEVRFFLGPRVGGAESMGIILAPYRSRHYTGMIGILGPIYMDYKKIAPMVKGAADALVSHRQESWLL